MLLTLSSQENLLNVFETPVFWKQKNILKKFLIVNLVPDRYRKVPGGMEHAEQIVQHDAMLSRRRDRSDCRSIVWKTFFSTIQIFVSEI